MYSQRVLLLILVMIVFFVLLSPLQPRAKICYNRVCELAFCALYELFLSVLFNRCVLFVKILSSGLEDKPKNK